MYAMGSDGAVNFTKISTRQAIGVSYAHSQFQMLAAALRFMFISAIFGCGSSTPDFPSTSQSSPTEAFETVKLFTDVTKHAGISFVHADGQRASYEFPRSMGSGCAWLDANGDDRLDILLIQGGPQSDTESPRLLAAVYLQKEDGRFADFSLEAGLMGSGYGMGVAVGDVDNDGDSDIYLPKYGPDQLFLNDGTGRFTDITQDAGIINPQWATAAAMTDLNRDGWLDVVVANYVDYFPGTFCADAAARQDFCGPQDFRGTPNRVFMNLGRSDDGKVHFEDRSAASGLASLPSKSLGLVCRDFDNDGDTDIFVANDGEANQLWIQNEETFTDEAFVRGVAVNRFGEPEANMGTLIGDFSGDGQLDLLVTHLSGEMNTLWQGDARGYFMDQTSRFRMGAAGLAQTGFGIVASDLDCDGRLEILVANGKVKRDRHRIFSGGDFWAAYAERNQIFLARDSDLQEFRDGNAGFTGPEEVSRGLATGDFDQDGDQDLLVTSIGVPARLYRNDAVRTGHWLSVRPYDPERKRVSYGAKVTVIAESRSWSAEIIPHTSYLSSLEPLAHFGLGAVSILTSVEVVWPDGPFMVEVFVAPATDQRVELIRGSGIERRTASVEEVP